MSNYRRLISYIYAYEGGIKGKNIGFAKIETRGAQCKITVSVKKVYMGGNDIGVYLLAGENEILLGNIFIRGGSGEFRAVVSVNDVEHSKIAMDQCYGLTIHDVENTWWSYTTIWEDAVAHAAEVDLSDLPSDKKEASVMLREAQIKKAMEEIEEEFPSNAKKITQKVDKKQDEIAREQLKAFTESAREQSKAFAENIRRQAEQSIDTAKQAAPQEAAADMDQSLQEAYRLQEEPNSLETLHPETLRPETLHPETLRPETLRPETMRSEAVHSEAVHSKAVHSEAIHSEAIHSGAIHSEAVHSEAVHSEAVHSEMMDSSHGGSGFLGIPATEPSSERVINNETLSTMHAGIWGADVDKANRVKGETVCYRSDAAQGEKQAPGDPQELERLLLTEEEESPNTQIWNKLRREHTKIQDFDYEKGCEILTVKPQDIGLLPREVWVYGNNSFLLHGYYNYRYLILAKLFNPGGSPRYLLGVPGHYYSNEKYMASMFGFPGFVLSKNQPMEDGRFGYWYTDISIGS